jgi:Flp pilus assembly protein CpaB
MLRRSPRALALRTAAVIVTIATAAVVASDLASLHRRAHDLGPEVEAVVARRDLTVGAMVDASDVSGRAVHTSQLPDGVIVGRGRVVGRVIAAPVLRGDFVTARHLAPRRRTGLDGIVPADMRAIRVTVSGALRPRAGAAVDVLASFDARNSEGADGASTVVVAEGVLVVSTDAHASGGTGRGDALGVTLLVSRDDAARLADAQANGVLTLALVPPEEASPMPRSSRSGS